jgi:uncharacterized membrane protein
MGKAAKAAREKEKKEIEEIELQQKANQQLESSPTERMTFVAVSIVTPLVPLYLYTTPIFMGNLIGNIVYFAAAALLTCVMLFMTYNQVVTSSRNSLVKERNVTVPPTKDDEAVIAGIHAESSNFSIFASNLSYFLLWAFFAFYALLPMELTPHMSYVVSTTMSALLVLGASKLV